MLPRRHHPATCTFFPVLAATALAGALPGQLDGSAALRYRPDQANPGLVVNGAEPGVGDLTCVHRSAYGVWRGREVWPDDGRIYPHFVVGRDGLLSALRTGTAGETLGPTGWRPDFTAGYTIGAWLRIHDHGENFGGSIFNLGSGYKQGWRLDFTKAHWVKEGRLSLVCGTENGSTGIEARPFGPEIWHHVALVAGDGKMSLYVNGERVGVTEEPLRMPGPRDRGADFRICGKWSSKAGLLDYRFDELVAFDRPLTGDEIKSWYEAGKPAGPDADLSEREAALALLSLDIPKDTWGYFPAGRPIPLTFSAPAGSVLPKQAVFRLADSNGAVTADEEMAFPASLPASIGREIVIGRPGLYELSMRLLDERGRTLKETVYPLGISEGDLPASACNWLGAVNTLLHPEPLALGVGLNRIVCHWGSLEPAKDEYDWTEVDFMVQDPRNEGLDLLVCLTGVPEWLEGEADAMLDERGAAAYRKIWAKLTARYPQVQFWEVGGATGLPHDDRRMGASRYRQQLEMAAAEIRKRGKTVIGARAHNASPEWAEAVLGNGGSAHLDVLSIDTRSADLADEILAARLEKIRAVCVAEGRPDLPVWNISLAGQTAEELVSNAEAQLGAGVRRMVIAPGVIDGAPKQAGLALGKLINQKEQKAEMKGTNP